MSKPISVGFLVPCFHRAGGSEQWLVTLLDHLDRSRITPVGVTVADEVEYDAERGAQLTRHCPVTLGGDACEALALQSDVVVAWGLGRLHEILPERLRRPRVVFVQHHDGSDPYWQTVCRCASPHTDGFVAVSEAAKRAIPKERHADTTVIPPGVDLRRLEPRLTRREQRRAWGLPDDVKVVGFLGRASDEKDPMALARAVASLPDPWVGIFVGDGPTFERVRVDSFALTAGRVRFPGPTHDVGSALAAFDVLLVPSREEGFGLSIVEAWMAGVPVVATPVGVALEHPELVEDVRIEEGGPILAAAILPDDITLAGREMRIANAINTALIYYSAQAFGRRWSDYLMSLAS